MKLLKYMMLAMSLMALPVFADDSETLDAAIGGAIGAGTGAAVTTDGDGHHDHDGHVYIDDGHRGHCPPGHAKKGHC